jgi:hypothetical protein
MTPLLSLHAPAILAPALGFWILAGFLCADDRIAAERTSSSE